MSKEKRSKKDKKKDFKEKVQVDTEGMSFDDVLRKIANTPAEKEKKKGD